MRELLIKQIKSFLDNYDGFFHSEQEVQILLAQHLLNTDSYNNVYVEYYVNRELIPDYPWNNDKKISIDIVVRKGSAYIPIEIKYKTTKQVFPHYVFGSQTHVELAHQGAQNEGCYSFWKDIKRIEIIKRIFNLNHSGLVLFITNDLTYLNPPRTNVQYRPFSIHEGQRIDGGTLLDWDNTRKPIKDTRSDKFPGFEISNNYLINWKDLNIQKHKYILV